MFVNMQNIILANEIDLYREVFNNVKNMTHGRLASMTFEWSCEKYSIIMIYT